MKKSTKTTRKTKSQKTVKTVAPVEKQVVVTHSRRQRFWGIVALVGLFMCGFMLGMDVQHKHVKTSVVALQSQEIAYENDEAEFKALPVCQQIESLLSRQLWDEDTTNPDDHVYNAKIYANLSERGCPENSQKYVDLAKQELQIARALRDDHFYDTDETIEVVETYKRLNMQAAAEEIFEKAKKLTNPAIDFILQVEKIINE